MLFERKYKYNPTKKEIDKALRFDYSLTNWKVIKEYKNWFVRINDYPYNFVSWTDIKVREHYLMIPKLWKSKVLENDRKEMYLVEEERSKLWYFIIRNPKKNQSIKWHYHKHIIKLID